MKANQNLGTASVASDSPNQSSETREAIRILENARCNFRQGDSLTNWEGEIRHRFAGVIANLPSLDEGNKALAAAGFRFETQSNYLPSATWLV